MMQTGANHALKLCSYVQARFAQTVETSNPYPALALSFQLFLLHTSFIADLGVPLPVQWPADVCARGEA